MNYWVGVDIGGTNILIGIIDEDYNIVAKKSIKTNPPRSAEEIADDILKTTEILCKTYDIPFSTIVGIGVACPGLVKDGIIINAANLKLENVDFEKIISQKFNKICAVCNDANAAALGEYVKGAGNEYRSLVAVTIGTGVGGGMVLDGKIWDGFNGAGAEIGHIVIIPQGRLCSCGNRGCLETYCSASALIKDTKEAMINNPNSKLWEVCDSTEDVNGKTVFEADVLGDDVANKLIENFINYLSIGITNIATLIQPEIICLGGGMSAEGDRLIKPLNDIIEKNKLMSSLKNKPKIIAATLFNDAGIIGAVANLKGKM